MSGALEASGGFEVPTPILNSPFVEPAEYWDLREGEPPQRLAGRRPAGYWYRDPRAGVQGPGGSRGVWREMPLVNAIRARLDEWRTAERPGISRVTAELLAWWERDGRDPRLFHALLSITPEQPMSPAVERTRILPLLAAPFGDANFRRLIVFQSSWNFAANLAAPFFAVYMLKTLGYSMTMVIVLTTASQLSNMAALGLWGNLIDRFSNKAVLEVSAPLFLACTLAWTFTGIPWVQPMTLYLLFAVHVLMGIATAGVALASGNIAMKLSPAGQATAFLAASSVVSATCAAIAPVIGGLCADFFAAHALTLAVTWKGGASEVTVQVLDFHSWTFYFGLSCLVGLYSLHRLSFVRETGGTGEQLLTRDLLLEARRSIHSLSSAAGLLRVVRLPSRLLQPRSEKSSSGRHE